MFTKLFWKDASERGIATAAQSLLALWTVAGIGLLDIDPKASVSVAGMAAVLSVLKSLVATVFGNNESASLVPSVGTVDTKADDSVGQTKDTDVTGQELDTTFSVPDDATLDIAQDILADDDSDKISDETAPGKPPTRYLPYEPEGDF